MTPPRAGCASSRSRCRSSPRVPGVPAPCRGSARRRRCREPGGTSAGTGFIAPVPRSGSGGTKVAVIVVGCLALVGLLLVGAVTFVGRTVENQTQNAPDKWTVHRDPAGRFQVELPGAPIKNTRSDPMPDGGAVTVDALDVARGPWNAVMYVIDVPDGAGLDVPLALMEEDLEQTITSAVPNSGYTGPLCQPGRHAGRPRAGHPLHAPVRGCRLHRSGPLRQGRGRPLRRDHDRSCPPGGEGPFHAGADGGVPAGAAHRLTYSGLSPRRPGRTPGARRRP